MLIFIHNDEKNITPKVLKSLKEKRPQANFFSYDKFDLSVNKFESLIFSNGLFDKKNIIKLSRILDKKELKDFFFDNLDKIQSSENAFVLLEDKLDSRIVKKIKEFSTKFYDETQKTKKSDFNIFNLSDLLLKKDKKNLWINFHKALEEHSLENIYGIFLWQLKNIILIEKGDDEKIKPFIKNKIKTSLKLWKENETREKYFQLLQIYHQSRVFSFDFQKSVEKFILDL